MTESGDLIGDQLVNENEFFDRKVRYKNALQQSAKNSWEFWGTNPLTTPKTEERIFDTPGPSPLYNQFDSGVGPNNDDCLSGCGATAWAILFAWADIQATKNEKWAPHAGIYRENGDLRSPDITAPETMDQGIMNMVWEIREAIGTWCYGDRCLRHQL